MKWLFKLEVKYCHILPVLIGLKEIDGVLLLNIIPTNDSISTTNNFKSDTYFKLE